MLPVAILAGGYATRLQPLTERIPKILVEVAGRPFAVHQLNLLKRSGIRHVVYCVGHLATDIEAYLGDGDAQGLKIQYSDDGPTPLGTGGAIKQALPLLGGAFMVLYGDSYLECDYAAVEAKFLASSRRGLMTVYRNLDQFGRSNVEFRNGLIRRYDKRSHDPNMQYIDYGLGAFKADAFDSVPQGANTDLAAVYQSLLAQGELAAHEVTERFYEIGSFAGLEETHRHLLSKNNS